VFHEPHMQHQVRNDGVRLGGLAATHLDRLMQRSRHPWPEYDAVAQRRECRGLGVRSQVRWAEGRRAEAAADFFFGGNVGRRRRKIQNVQIIFGSLRLSKEK